MTVIWGVATTGTLENAGAIQDAEGGRLIAQHIRHYDMTQDMTGHESGYRKLARQPSIYAPES